MANLIYKLHPRHAKRATLVTTVDGRAVNLTGKPATKTYPATDTSAEWSEEIPAATQAELKAVLERGDKDVDGFPIVVAEAKAPSATDKK